MNPSDANFHAVVGVDWADTKHDFCIGTGDGHEYGQVKNTVEAVNQWAQGLQERFNGPVAVVLELNKGPLVSMLIAFPHITVYPVNPAALAKYRQTFALSRAKDDPSDAFLLADLFQRHPERLKPLSMQSTAMRTLQQLTQARTELRGDITRLTNRITSALKNYFPQALQWFDKKDTRLFCHFIQQWPTANKARMARKNTLLKFFHDHNVRRSALIDRRIADIKALTPLTDDPAVIEPGCLRVEVLVQQLLILIDARAQYDQRIKDLARSMDDEKIFASFPGAAKVTAPKLMAAFGEDRNAFDSANNAQKAFAVAPVIERSGNKSWTHWRWHCNKNLRQTLVEFSALSIPHSFWAKAYYQQQKDKGSSHNAALRALAFKWTRILYRCWKNRETYDEAQYLEALRKRQSPLLKYIAEMPAN